MRLSFAVLALIAVAAFTGCPANNPPQPPPSPPSPAYAPPDAGAPPTPIDVTDAPPARGAAGAACATAADCDSGACEGQGCDDAHPGKCAAKGRMCTMDVQDYCGCDGATFSSSGSCPGRRFDHRGACAPPTPPTPPAKKNPGEACLSNDDCAGGICEGQGCDDAHPGTCADPKRRCAHNRTPFCGCDGKTITASSTCTGTRYLHRGKC